MGKDATASLPPPSFMGGDVLAGTLARAMSQSTIHPIDTIKVRMQTSMHASTSSKYGLGTTSGTVQSPNPVQGAPRTGAGRLGHGLQMKWNLRGMHKNAGKALSSLGSLYKGCGGAAAGASISMTAYFASYGLCVRTLEENTDLGVSAVAFIAGAAGAIGSSAVKIPAAVCIRSVQADVYPNVIKAAGRIYKAAGIRGLYTGYVPTVLEDIPDMAVKFAAYESLRQFHRRLMGRNTHVSEDLAIGGAAGALAAAASTPLDVIKTRMMTSAASRPTMGYAVKKIIQDGGYKGFMTGVWPRAVSNGVNSAIFFCFFEAIRSSQREQWAKKIEEEIFRAAVERGDIVPQAAAENSEIPSWRRHLMLPTRRRLMYRRGTAVN